MDFFDNSTPKENKDHLVLVGFSFAGFQLLHKLQHLFKVTVVEKKGFFEWTTGTPHSIHDEEYFKSVRDCFVYINERFSNDLLNHFDVKCYDFKQQFTGYITYMDSYLESRRYETDQYVQRETNSPRDKDSECIWKRPDLLEKTRNYLINNIDYYGFCNKCLGSEDELTVAPAAPSVSA